MQKKCWLLSLCMFSSVYGTYCRPPGIDDHFQLRADWMYLRRSDFPERTIAINTAILEPDGDFEDALKSQNLTHDWNWKTGVYGNITYVSDHCASLEAVYYYVYPWHGRGVTGSDIGALAFPFKETSFTTDYNTANFVEAKYTSQLQNGEFNYWGHLTPRRVNYFSASWIFGGRFIYLGEKLNLSFTSGSDLSNYRIKTTNLLYGAQAGFVFEINPGRRWTWTVQIKGAAFLNDASNDVFLGDQNNTLVLRDYDKKRWQGAFLIEGIGSLTYQWYEHLNIHAGYQGTFATGFALAPNQLEKSSGEQREINISGNVVFDGFITGMTLSF